MSKPEDRYGLLPEVPEHIVDKMLSEVGNFATFMRHDPEGAKRSIMNDIGWLKENKDFLGWVSKRLLTLL